MAALIKNQIIKHLSKFAKNLSPDKINLSALKGEGELTDLELNEDALMELMSLPTWLRLTKAFCNKIVVRIHWSKLKTLPIYLSLDEVEVEMEIVDTLRTPTEGGMSSYRYSTGRYRYADSVVDGIHLSINNVTVNIVSKAFKAELQISRIVIQSKTPAWRETPDLRYTKVSDKERDLMLLFKELQWQTLKFEANCMVGGEESGTTTPLRFITTNLSKLRLVTKKKYSDCSIVATNVHLIVDDLLWILTDSQMKATVVFAKLIMENIERAAEQTRNISASRLKKQHACDESGLQPGGASQTGTPAAKASPITTYFNRHDIKETLYRVQTNRIDLHICDDMNTKEPSPKRRVTGGVLGVSIMKLSFLHIPLRLAGSQKHSQLTCLEDTSRWGNSLLRDYYDRLGALGFSPSDVQLGEKVSYLSVEDFYVTTVNMGKESTKENSRGVARPLKLVHSDKVSHHLPKDMAAVSALFLDYSFINPPQYDVPLPFSNFFAQVNPIKVCVDLTTVEWLNSFALSLFEDMEVLLSGLSMDLSEVNPRHVDFKVDLLMPRIVMNIPMDKDEKISKSEIPISPEGEPTAISVCASHVVCTNADVCGSDLSSDGNSSLAELRQQVDDAASSRLSVNQAEFPGRQGDHSLASTRLFEQALSERGYSRPGEGAAVALLPQAGWDVELWRVHVEQIWVEFSGRWRRGHSRAVPICNSRPTTCVEPLPLTLWLAMESSLPFNMASGGVVKEGGSSSNSKCLNQQDDSSEPKEVRCEPHVGVLLRADKSALSCQVSPGDVQALVRLVDSVEDLAFLMDAERQAYAQDARDAAKSKNKATTELRVSLFTRLCEIQLALLVPHEAGMERDGDEIPSHVVPSATSSGASSDSPGSAQPPALSETKPESNSVEGLLLADSEQPIMTPEEKVEMFHSKSMHYDDSPHPSPSSEVPPRGFPVQAGHVSPLPTITVEGGGSGDGPGNAGSRTSAKISGLFNQMTSRVKQTVSKHTSGNMTEGDHSPSDWDAQSIQSAQSDEDEFLMVNYEGEEEVPVFDTHNQAGFENTSSLNDKELSAPEKGQLKVNVSLLKVGSIELGFLMSGSDMVCKLTMDTFKDEDRGLLELEEFRHKFMAEQRGVAAYPPVSARIPPVLVRFERGPSAEEKAWGGSRRGFLTARVSQLSTDLLAISLRRLGRFAARSERAVRPVPMLVELNEVELSIRDEDTDELTMTSSTSVKKMRIENLIITGSANGQITIQGGEIDGRSERSLKTPAVLTAERGILTEECMNPSGTEASSVSPESFQCLLKEKEAALNEVAALHIYVADIQHTANEGERKVNDLQSENLTLRERLQQCEQQIAMSSATNSIQVGNSPGGAKPRTKNTIGDNNLPPAQLSAQEAEASRRALRALKNKLDDQQNELEALRVGKACLTDTIRLLQKDLTELERKRKLGE